MIPSTGSCKPNIRLSDFCTQRTYSVPRIRGLVVVDVIREPDRCRIVGNKGG
ncbi:MAG: hypothetical protein ACMUHX_06410 [bacterium]